jgi:preprotein translocase subunit YajC
MRLMDLVIAMGRQEDGGKGGSTSTIPFFAMIALMFAVLWFLMIRPQRQREARRREMLGQVRKSDHVVTIGGVHGVVTQIRGDDIVLKVDEANNVKMTFTRSAIARVIDKSADSDAESGSK